MFKGFLAAGLVLLVAGAPAIADCGYRTKASECNGIGGDADDYSGCSVETSNGWYNIKISSGSISGELVCRKFPGDGYCGCSDYGIY